VATAKLQLLLEAHAPLVVDVRSEFGDRLVPGSFVNADGVGLVSAGFEADRGLALRRGPAFEFGEDRRGKAAVAVRRNSVAGMPP
jgi:hypothetical protein